MINPKGIEGLNPSNPPPTINNKLNLLQKLNKILKVR